jgi:O-antigen/teichoic acid export membrane protein
MINATLNRVRAIFSLLRLRPFDTTAPQGRSNERHRLIIMSSLTSAIAKLITIGTALISVPLTLHYLGPERYGMWMTMSSFLVMLSFADLGIGNGLLNAVASAYGRDDRQEIYRYVSSGFFVLTIIATTILVLFAIAYRHVPWFEIFNVQSDLARNEAGPALAIVIVCIALGVPASIVQRVQTGMQRGFIANLWQCLASILGLVGIIIVIRLEGGLPWLVLAFVGAPLGASALNSLIFFGRFERDIAPSLMAVSRDAVTDIVHTGSLFLGLQISGSIISASDSIFIAQVLGPEAVTQYSVPERMFYLITSLAAMVLAPLWPAYGEANARGDNVWVKRTLMRSLFTAVVFAALAASILFFTGPLIIRVWVGDAVTASSILLLGLALWKVIETGGAAVAMLLNSHNMIRFQFITATLVAISVVPLKIVLLRAMGVSGVVWATIICYAVFSALPTYIFFRRWWKL